MKKSLITLMLSLPVAACAPGEPPAVSFDAVAQAAARAEDRVDVETLASWIIESRGDFHLVDVRSAADFDKGSIADAEHIPLARLASAEVLATLPRDRKVIVFSNGSETAAKAVVMLRLSGVNALLVAGGYNAWHARILNPDIPVAALDGEALEVTAQRAFACYFVGDRDALAPAADAEPFVPPVFETPGELDALPPPQREQGC